MSLICINNLWWDVYGCKKNAPILESEDEELLGMTVFAKSEIWIRTEDVSEGVLKRTIKHELVHAWIFSYGINGEDMCEEDICNFFEAYGEEIMEAAKEVYDSLMQEHRMYGYINKSPSQHYLAAKRV